MSDNPAPSRVTIERRPEGLVIAMPVPRSGCVIAFLGMWLSAWAVAEFAGVMGLIEQAGRTRLAVAAMDATTAFETWNQFLRP